MHAPNDVRERIRVFLRQNFYREDELRDDASLLEEGVIDSTGVLELIVFLEETFGFCVADEEMLPEHLDSVDRLTVYVARKMEAPAPAAPSSSL